jgi:hypothetical protein
VALALAVLAAIALMRLRFGLLATLGATAAIGALWKLALAGLLTG